MSRVKGVNKLLSELRKLPKEAEKDLAQEVEFAARSMEKEAKIRCPVDEGFLRNSIKAEQGENVLTWNVTAYADYAAYQEFGTGGLVQVPSELVDQAIKWKRAGIRQANLKPQPFLYPALVVGRKRFLDRVKRLVDKFGGKL